MLKKTAGPPAAECLASHPRLTAVLRIQAPKEPAPYRPGKELGHHWWKEAAAAAAGSCRELSSDSTPGDVGDLHHQH